MRIAVIGFGVMGERLVRATLDHPDDEIALAGVWDPSGAAMDRLKATIPAAPVLASAEAAMAADCVYIASPPSTHLAHARKALAAGKAVFLEKPLGVDLAESRAFVEDAAGERVAVNFVFASSPAVAQLHEWLSEGVVGAPDSLAIETDFAVWPRDWQEGAATWLSKSAEGGFTREVVSHFLFLTARMLGATTLRDAAATFPGGDGAETAIRANLEAGGVPIALNGGVGTTEKSDHNLWRLKGAAGQIRLRDWSTAERLHEDGEWRSAADVRPHAEVRPLILRGQLSKLKAMTAGQSNDLATPAEALAVQELVEAILAAKR